jgi:hypothetical protein
MAGIQAAIAPGAKASMSSEPYRSDANAAARQCNNFFFSKELNIHSA